jgi:hypothetical protein
MREIQETFWSPKPYNSAFAILTDGYVKKNGEAVLGRGIGLEARRRFPGLAKRLGKKLINQGRIPGNAGIDLGVGNHVTIVYGPKPWIATFPFKWVFFENADLQLIERSAYELIKLADNARLKNIYLPPIGDGHEWAEVREILCPIFDDRFKICMRG